MHFWCVLFIRERNHPPYTQPSGCFFVMLFALPTRVFSCARVENIKRFTHSVPSGSDLALMRYKPGFHTLGPMQLRQYGERNKRGCIEGNKSHTEKQKRKQRSREDIFPTFNHKNCARGPAAPRIQPPPPAMQYA